MAKTNSGLVSYAKAQVGKPYWYGTYGQTATASLYSSKKKQYPTYYTASDFTSQYGQRVHDCVGLIKGYIWSSTATSTPTYVSSQDKNCTGMYSAASTKGKISTFPKTAGLLVFKGSAASSLTHVGVYGGDGYVYEAKGHAYGVVKTTFKSSDWTFWCQCPYVTDDTTGSTTTSTTTTATSTTVTTSSTASTTGTFVTGGKVTLSSTPIYSTATTTTKAGTKTGTYYIWSTVTSNNRIRITNSASNAGKSGQITGWVNVSDITASTSSTASSTTSTSSSGVDSAASYSKSIAGTYTVTASTLNVRAGAGTSKTLITTLKKGATVQNYGYYTSVNGVKWLYIQFTQNGKTVTGFACGTYLKK